MTVEEMLQQASDEDRFFIVILKEEPEDDTVMECIYGKYSPFTAKQILASMEKWIVDGLLPTATGLSESYPSIVHIVKIVGSYEISD